MSFKTYFFAIAFVAFSNVNYAQKATDTIPKEQSVDDLLNNLEAEKKPTKELVYNAFKSSRVINGHSLEMIGAGVLDFRILHRFGSVKTGAYALFGLDNATMRMGYDYGVTKDFTVGIGRSTNNKEYDGFLKYRLKQQSIGEKAFPMSIVAVAGMTYFTTKWPNPAIRNYNTSRLGYYGQLIVGKKVNDNFTFQLAPTIVHRNLVELATDANDLISLGIGTRIKLSNRMAFIIDAFPAISGARSGYNQMPLSVGIDIETGGHVFQLHFSNATGMNEKAFITETTQKWGKGEFNFGFNLSRVFTIKKNKATSY
jgi:Membrane bound beta barrel domain (DUF5777)